MTASAPRFACLATDLDGTLLDERGRMPDEVTAFLGEVQDAGVHVIAATGRRLSSALPFLERAGLRGGCVVQNGSLVATVPAGEVLRAFLLEEGTVRRLFAFLAARGLHPVVYRHLQSAGPGEVIWERTAADPTGFLQWYGRHAAGHCEQVDDLGAVALDSVIRLTTYQSRARLGEVVEELAAAFEPEVRSFLTYDPVRRIDRLEILPGPANKWSGIEFLAARLEVQGEQTLAVGDDRNDVEMLAAAGYSLAAPGATPEAAAAASAIVDGEGPLAVIAAVRAQLFGAGV
jgi:hydroxymethylpyrimidine pyrophosphatase-like HAD family hydrolase